MQQTKTKFRFLLTCLFAWLAFGAYAQTTVSGKVTDAENGEGLPMVTVLVKNTSLGTVTDTEGAFSMEVGRSFPFTITFSSVGYANQEVLVKNAEEAQNVSVRMGQSVFMMDEVTISGSRQPERITESPVTIGVIKAEQIAELPSFNVGELFARKKGVDYVRSGVLGVGLNVRGFNSAFNPKNLQLTDGRFSTLIATGLPLGALNTVVKEDIERTEVVLGPSSALYGPNAHNGLVNTITKDPRAYQGTTIALGAGNQSVFSGRFRHAQVLSDKFAFKVTGEYTRGEEFDYVDTVYIGAAAFPELDLDLTFESLRGEATLYFSPTDDSDIILQYGGSNSSNIGVTNAGRNQIKDWQIHYLHLRYTSPRLFAQVYHTWSVTNDTYAMNQRTQNYQSFIAGGFSEAEARERSLLEQWFPVPGLPAGGVPLNRGALFIDDSRRWNGEVQYNNDFGIDGFNLVAGVQVQSDFANSRGTYLLDNDGEGITINQIGGYAQVEKKFGDTGLKTVLAARADNHDLYGFNFIPKAALVYTTENAGSFRLTYGQGIAAPTILNLEGNIFGGLLVGNGQGFTLSDGTTIDPLKVETIQTVEVGYKGKLSEKLFLDVNAYYNVSKDFLSPAINIANPAAGILVTQRGDQPMSELQPGFATDAGSALVLTYLNFGNVDTYGFDMGLNYYINDKFNISANYSYFGYSLDKDDMSNDGNRNGIVTNTDLPINTPAHKANIAFNASTSKWFGSVFVRWVEAYDFFSGINVAAKTQDTNGDGTNDVVENARVGRTWNYGPLGGFVNVDVSFGYRFNDIFTLSGQVSNVFDSEVREFVASPVIGRLYSVEARVNLPAIGKKK
ncbi:MAG: TonB-dependent receptor domain-containing protein [Bernardetiaceae bacterium]